MGQLSRIMDDVREFHEALAPDWLPGLEPAPLTLDEALTRSKWVRSEMAELERDTPTKGQLLHGDGEDAVDTVDVMAKQADAFIDAIYFAAGGLCRLGLDPSPLWSIVHGQNMAKVHPDGTVKRREDGKIIKPEGWVDPHQLLVAEVRRQLGR